MMKKIVATVISLIIVCSSWVLASGPAPEAIGRYGYYDGNTLNELEQQKIFYIAGVFDALTTVSNEVFYMLADPEIYKSLNITVTDWDKLTKEQKAAALLTLIIIKVSSSVNTPNGVLLGQIKTVVDNYLSSHPTELQNNAALLTWRALAGAEWK